MHFINKSRNSVYLEDIDLSIPYLFDEAQEIDVEKVKKSRSFRRMVQSGAFFVIKSNGSRIENNLLRVSNSYKESQIPSERLPSTTKMHVRLRGHFYDNTGYAKVNRNLALYLARNKIDTSIDAVTNLNNLNEVDARIISTLRRPFYENSILIDSVVLAQALVEYSGKKILYTTAEVAEVPSQFIDVAKNYDELWVTSNFCKDAYKSSGYDKEIYIVPPIINCNLYKPTHKMNFRPSLSEFNYLSVHTFGYRKGSDALIRAFCHAYTKYDNVSLTILSVEVSKVQRKKIRQQILDLKNEFANPPTINIIFKSIQEYLMPSFYSAFDCFVLCSRGEGFGLPICEASLCGLPIISVNYSAMTDYLNVDNSCLLEIDGLEKVKDVTGVFYWDNKVFPQLGGKFVDSLAVALREIRKNYDNYKDKNNKLQDLLREKFDGRSAISTVLTRLDYLWKKA